jgi:hypothetical protein
MTLVITHMAGNRVILDLIRERRAPFNPDANCSIKHRIIIEVHTASFRTTRGYTIVAALCDEIAYWPTDESASEPDVEVIAAVKPAMATVPGALLLCASSPHARKGALWDAHRKHYGNDGDVLVWQAATRDMNPTVPQSYIDRHLADDPARASAEYLAEFRRDRAVRPRSAVTSGRQLFYDGDANSAWSRRFHDLVISHINDVSAGHGANVLSEAQLSLCRRAAAIECELERLDAMSTISAAFRNRSG